MSGGGGDVRLGFAGNRLERGGETRTEATLGAALAHPQARVFVAAEGVWLCRGDGETGDPVLDLATARALGADLSAAVLLGHDAAGAPSLAVTASAAAGAGSGLAAVGLRPLANGGALDPDIEGQLGQAEHFLNLARQVALLRALRDADRPRGRRLPPQVPRLRRHALSPDRPGLDHADP